MSISKKKSKSEYLKKFFSTFLLMFTASLFIYFCIKDNNLLVLIDSIKSLNLFWLLLSFLSIFLCWFLDSTSIYVIARSISNRLYKRSNAFGVTMTGQYFGAITPFSSGSMPMQIVTMLKQGLDSGTALSILVQKFFIYQTTLILYSLASIVFCYDMIIDKFPYLMPFIIIGFLVQSGAIIAVFAFSVSRKVMVKIVNACIGFLHRVNIIKDYNKVINNVYEQVDLYIKSNKNLNKDKKRAAKLYAISFLQITSLFIIPFFIYKAFKYSGYPVLNILSIQSLITMITAYTPLPGSAGTSEGGFLILFDLLFTANDTPQAMILWRFITYYSCILFGAFFVIINYKKKKSLSSKEENNFIKK